MPRQAVIIRPATEDDIPVLVEMHDELRRGQRKRTTAETARLAAELRYREALQSADHRVLVAITSDGQIGGMTMLAHTDFALTLDNHVIHVAQTCVRHDHRHKGIGRALVAAATSWAEELGVGSVTLSVVPTQRETHRYYARLGFSPRVVLRTASVPTLRRTLGLETARPLRARRAELAAAGRSVVRARRATEGARDAARDAAMARQAG